MQIFCIQIYMFLSASIGGLWSPAPGHLTWSYFSDHQVAPLHPATYNTTPPQPSTQVYHHTDTRLQLFARLFGGKIYCKIQYFCLCQIITKNISFSLSTNAFTVPSKLMSVNQVAAFHHLFTFSLDSAIYQLPSLPYWVNSEDLQTFIFLRKILLLHRQLFCSIDLI